MCCPLEDSGESYAESSQCRTTLDAAASCCECCASIPAHVEHEVYLGRNGYNDSQDVDDESTWDEWRTCLLCVEIRDHFACDGWIFGRLWEDLEQNFFPDMKMGGPCMRGLSPAAKSALVDARTEWLFSADGCVESVVALPPWWRWWYGDADPSEGQH
jgi:hypothetical protein